jgi:DNA-binding transcriptional LysR family regulator
MDIHTLTYFKKVAELQHITRAAEELHIAQPSLSRTISGLEKELKVQLFERTGKNIVLNPYGAIVLRHTNRIMQELRDIENELNEAQGVQNRTVTISLYAASKLLPKLVMNFKREYPSIRLRIHQEDLSRRESDECDLSISSSIQPSRADNVVTLMEEEILLALPESSPFSQRGSLCLKEVEEEEFICLQRGKSLRNITDMYCKMAGFEPSVV